MFLSILPGLLVDDKVSVEMPFDSLMMFPVRFSGEELGRCTLYPNEVWIVRGDHAYLSPLVLFLPHLFLQLYFAFKPSLCIGK